MTDDYVPLTDEQVGAIRDDLQWRVPDVLRRILADREHYKRRAETAEQWRKDHNCPMPITRGFEWTRGY